MAALLSCLPSESRTVAALAPDASWTRLEVLQAMTFNALAAVFGGEDAPQVPIPGAEKPQDARHIGGQAMTPEELMEILSRPRTPAPDSGGGE